MLRVIELIGKVITLRAPPILLVYALRNKLDRWFKTGNRRFEFERRYLENPDPWNYRSSAYEREKYERTLALALAHSPRTEAALEIGCSVGVFTKMAAARFGLVTAVDLSKEALAAARVHTRDVDNVEYVIGDLRTLNLPRLYDVIFCAEVLYYIAELDAPTVAKQLTRYLTPGGVMVMVTLLNKPDQGFFYFDDWERALSPGLKVISKEKIDHPVRPYEVVIFSQASPYPDDRG